MMKYFFVLCDAVWSKICGIRIRLKMQAVCSSETSVNFCLRCHIREDSSRYTVGTPGVMQVVAPEAFSVIVTCADAWRSSAQLCPRPMDAVFYGVPIYPPPPPPRATVNKWDCPELPRLCSIDS